MKKLGEWILLKISNIGLKLFFKSWLKVAKEELLITNDKGLYQSSFKEIYDSVKEADKKLNNILE